MYLLVQTAGADDYFFATIASCRSGYKKTEAI